MNPALVQELCRHMLQGVHDTAAGLIADGIPAEDVATAVGLLSETLEEYRQAGVGYALREQIRAVMGAGANQMFPIGGRG